MKVAIIGSRSLNNINLASFIDGKPELIISGGAKGIDTLAEQYAKNENIPIKVLKPDYQKYGRGAPFIRNKQIIDESEMVYAFWDGISKGTLHSINYAKSRGKEIKIIKC